MTKEQIENWRRVLGGILGPYAFLMSEEDIIKMRDKLQKQANYLVEDDPQKLFDDLIARYQILIEEVEGEYITKEIVIAAFEDIFKVPLENVIADPTVVSFNVGSSHLMFEVRDCGVDEQEIKFTLSE
jgi:hypothetical protein